MVKYTRAYKDFSGGLSEVANDNIPDNRLVVAKNVQPGDGYGIARAWGTKIAYAKLPTDTPVTMLAELEESDEPHVVACTPSGGYWHLWDWDGMAWRQIDGNIKPMKDWFVYARKLFWLDGQHFWCYDGTSVAEVRNDHGQSYAFWSKIQTAVAVEQRNQRWFFATKDNEVIVSEVGFFNKFVETNIINVTTGISDHITALHQFNEGILVFQQRAVYYLSGWDLAGGSDVKLSRLSVESGTRWPKSIQTISNAVLYLGDGGVYRLNIPYVTSSIAATNISDKQASKRLTETATDVAAVVYNGVYYIVLHTSTGIKEYRYYLNSGAWWGEYTQEPYCFGARLRGRDRLFIGCDNGYVLYYDPDSYNYTDTATGEDKAIEVEVKTKGYDVVGRTVVDGKIKRAFMVLRQFHAEKSHLEVQIKTDYQEQAFTTEADGMVWGLSEWGAAYWGWIDPVTKMMQINRKCKRCQFIVRSDALEEPLMIYGVALLYKRKKAKGSQLNVFKIPVTYDD